LGKKKDSIFFWTKILTKNNNNYFILYKYKKDMSSNFSRDCPPSAQKSCPNTGCIPDFSQASAKLGGYGSAQGGGNLPNGPLVPCIDCPSSKYPDNCRTDICNLSPLARIIIAIIELSNVNGVSNDEILAQHNQITCPSKPLTLAEITVFVNRGVRNGALRRVLETDNVRVYGFFGQIPANLNLLRELGTDYQLCLGMFGCSAIA
jgi:hypothetical protein